MALLSAALGYERITRWHWLGTCLSLAGLYLVVGRAVVDSGATVAGDVLTAVAVVCWTVYTVLARSLLARHSPLPVTGYALVFAAIMYAPLGLGDLARIDWETVSPGAWLGLVYSSVFAISVAYLIWYTAVHATSSAVHVDDEPGTP